jgi:hypothetical protein
MEKNTDTTKDNKATEQSDESTATEGRNIQVHIPPDLEYHYRDIANVFVGAGDVVLEFGNFHRSMPNNATISNRIVLSVASAYKLQNSLGQALANAQQRLQQNLNK